MYVRVVGIAAVGTVQSGILRVGMRLRVQRGGAEVPGMPLVEVKKISISMPTRVELYRDQYGKNVEEAGPGFQIGIVVEGIPKDALRAGDLLYE